MSRSAPWTRGLAAVALVWLAGAVQAGPSGEELLAREAPGVADALARDKVVVLDGARRPEEAGFVLAYALFARSRQQVVDLIVQSERQREYRPELRAIRLIRDGPIERVDEHQIKILFKDIVYRLRYRRERALERIEWGLDPEFENDLRRLDGFWEFYDMQGGRTLGRFGSVVDVGPALPDFVQTRLSRQTVVKTVENTRLWVDSDGQWRP